MDLKSCIRDIPGFPKPGILFRDITTLLQNPQALKYTVDALAERFSEHSIDYIIGTESRGFIFGTPLAYRLDVGFIPVRKPGKLPAAVYSANYELEYGVDQLELHQDALTPDSRVLVVDDLIATGGTAAATVELVRQADATVVGFGFIIELVDLNGRSKLPSDVIVETLVQY
ncbi:MAG: adenine phosphoribosyltransferase [Merismopedia sp. SIO2A8]|nr:adenine phosphoribosyltransferase [Merismopedia sp. SIO2A8]